MSQVLGHQIRANSVSGSGKLVDSAVDTSHLDALGEAAFAAGAGTTAKVADNAVTQSKIADGQVKSGDIASYSSISSGVTEAKLAANALSTAKITDSHVSDAKLAADSVVTAGINADAITKDKLSSNSVNNASMFSGDIDPAKLNTSGIGNITFTGDVTVGQSYGSATSGSVISKSIVDNLTSLSGVATRESVLVQTSEALPFGTPTVSGNTITAGGAGVLVLDEDKGSGGATPQQGDRVFISSESGLNAVNLGIYTLTTVGDATTSFVLTRASDFDTGADVTGVHFFVEQGYSFKNKGYVVSSNSSVVGTDNLTFSDFNASQYSGTGGLSTSLGAIAVNTTTFSAFKQYPAIEVTSSNKLLHRSRRVVYAATTSTATNSSQDTGITQFKPEEDPSSSFAFASFSEKNGTEFNTHFKAFVNGQITFIKTSSSGTEPLFFYNGSSVVTQPKDIPASGGSLRWDAQQAGFDLPAGSVITLEFYRE